MAVCRAMLETRSTSDCLRIRMIAEDTTLTAVQRMALINEVTADFQRNLDAVPLWAAIVRAAHRTAHDILNRRYAA